MEVRKIKKSELVIKKTNDFTFITTKLQDSKSEQVIIYLEYGTKKFLAIAPRQVNNRFRYTHSELGLVLIELTKNLKGTKYANNGVYNPETKEFKWNLEIKNNEINAFILEHMTKVKQKELERIQKEETRKARTRKIEDRKFLRQLSRIKRI